ncbi:unnamed protein product, partial [Polarella glacialis]
SPALGSRFVRGNEFSQSSVSFGQSRASAGSKTSLRQNERLMRKSQSDGALHGIAANTQSENVRAHRQFDTLQRRQSASTPAVGSSKGRGGRDSCLDDGGQVIADMKDFDNLSSAISQLNTSFQAGFDPRRAKQQVSLRTLLNGGKITVAATSGAGPEDEEVDHTDLDASERKRERLQAYKFARKLEPELPPLARLPPGSFPPKTYPPQGILARNASVEAIGSFRPHIRKEVIQKWTEELQCRTDRYVQIRDVMLETIAEKYSEDIERKRSQAEVAVALRRSTALRKKSSSSDFPVKKWFSLLWTAGFIAMLREEVAMKKLTDSERVIYLAENSQRLIVKRSKCAKVGLTEASRMTEIMRDPAIKRCVGITIAIIKLKKNLREHRSHAAK